MRIHGKSGGSGVEETNLYYRLGGQKAIRAVVEEFYRRMLEDELVNEAFRGIDMDRLRNHQTAFLSYALGGPVEYDGRTLREGHKGLNITSEQYERMIRIMNDTLRTFNVADEDRVKIEAFLRSVKPFVVGQ
jgi:hemoglobin